MNANEFCYWLQGYFELNHSNYELNEQQVKVIKDHLKLVFNKVTPDYSKPVYYKPNEYIPSKPADILNDVHHWLPPRDNDVPICSAGPQPSC